MILFTLLLAAVACFVSTAPGWFDTAELALGVRTLGVTHPTGHPAYVLLAHPWTWVPVGSVAFRTSLFSLACLAGTVGFSILTLRSLVGGGRRDLEISVAALLAVSVFLGTQTTRTEVYAATLLALSAVVWMRAAYERSRDARFAIALSFVLGLALSIHPVIALCAFVCFPTPHTRLAVLFLLLGAATYLYVPLRAHAHPALDWGAPDRLSSLFRTLLATDYAAFRVPAMPPLSALGWFGHSLGWIVLPLAIVGALDLHRKIPFSRRLLGMASLNLACAAWTGIYARNPDALGYLLPAAWIATVFAAFGWVRIVSMLPVRIHRGAFGLAVVACFWIVRGEAVPAWESHGADTFDAFVSGFERQENAAIVQAQADHWVFQGWYLQDVEGRRPDLLWVAHGLTSTRWYRAQVRGKLDDAHVRPRAGATEDPTLDDLARDRLLAACTREDYDRFGIREGMCAQMILSDVRSDVAAGRSDRALAFLGAHWNFPPSQQPCVNPKPIALPFALQTRTTPAFLPSEADLRNEYRLLYGGCFGSVADVLGRFAIETEDDRSWQALAQP